MPDYEVKLTWTYWWLAEDVEDADEAIAQALEAAGDHVATEMEPEIEVVE